MHWLHSVDQIIYSVGGACYTKLEFIRVLHELAEDRRFALASSVAEGTRSHSKTVLSREIHKDPDESETNRVRARADLLENVARTTIAEPAWYAGRVELFAIERILDRVKENIDYSVADFQKVQRHESNIAAIWQATLEQKTYGNVTVETASRLHVRNLVSIFNAAVNDASRYTVGTLYFDAVGCCDFPCIESGFFDSLYDAVVADIAGSSQLDDYAKALEKSQHTMVGTFNEVSKYLRESTKSLVGALPSS